MALFAMEWLSRHEIFIRCRVALLALEMRRGKRLLLLIYLKALSGACFSLIAFTPEDPS